MSIRRRFDNSTTESPQARWQRRSTLPANPSPVTPQEHQERSNPNSGRASPVAAEEPVKNNYTGTSSVAAAIEEIQKNITGGGGGDKFEPKRRSTTLVPKQHRRAESSPLIPATSAAPQIISNPMQAIRLQKKYPQVTQEEIFQLIEKFK